MLRPVSLALALLVPHFVGCSGHQADDPGHDADAEGTPSQAACAPGSALTYESFGKPFMAKYCTRCHSGAVAGAERQGAPADHNFDDLAGILPMAGHIDGKAAAGPAAVNTTMPPSGVVPSVDERRQLGEWLACETTKK